MTSPSDQCIQGVQGILAQPVRCMLGDGHDGSHVAAWLDTDFAGTPSDQGGVIVGTPYRIEWDDGDPKTRCHIGKTRTERKAAHAAA